MAASMRAGVLALLLSTASFAQTSEPVDRYLLAASQLYENLEYERALDQLARAKKLSRGPDDDTTIALYQGLIYADMGKQDESQAAFKEGLFLKPDAPLPTKVSPKVEAQFEALRAQVKRELAPVLSKRKAEEESKRAEAARIDAQRKSELDRMDAAQRRAEADRKAAEADRKLAEEERRAADKAAATARTADSDRPERKDSARSLVAQPLGETSNPPAVQIVEVTPPSRQVPVLPFVFGGAALAAGGVGAFFGAQSQSSYGAAKNPAAFQDDANNQLNQAKSSALTANILFAVAGGAAIAAVVAWVVAPSPPPSTITPAP